MAYFVGKCAVIMDEFDPKVNYVNFVRAVCIYQNQIRDV